MFQNNMVCAVCNNGYVRNTTGQCLSAQVYPALANCLQAKQDPNLIQCQLCQDNFVMVNYVCQAPAITGCDVYDGSNNLIQICLSCKDGFYLSSNTCVQGATVNCRIFNKQGICTQCSNGYVLVTLQDTSIVCMKVNVDTNCLTFRSDQSNGRNIECLQCKPTFLLDTLSKPNTVCSSFDKIDNCALYENTTLLYNTVLKCLRCEATFYLKDNACIKNKNVVGCKTYSLTSDTCELCEDPYYLSTDKTLCVPLPTGILNCLAYSSSTDCSQCKPLMYLVNNTCQAVP